MGHGQGYLRETPLGLDVQDASEAAVAAPLICLPEECATAIRCSNRRCHVAWQAILGDDPEREFDQVGFEELCQEKGGAWGIEQRAICMARVSTTSRASKGHQGPHGIGCPEGMAMVLAVQAGHALA